MAYFQRNQRHTEPGGEYTRHFSSAPEEESGDWNETAYDDGFDTLMEEDFTEDEEDQELSEEDLQQEKRRKYRIAASFGDLGATVLGVIVILALVAFLINMIRFLSNDFSQNFSLLQTKF